MRWAIWVWMFGRPIQLKGGFDRMQDAQRGISDVRKHISNLDKKFGVQGVWVGRDMDDASVWLNYQSTMRWVNRDA